MGFSLDLIGALFRAFKVSQLKWFGTTPATTADTVMDTQVFTLPNVNDAYLVLWGTNQTVANSCTLNGRVNSHAYLADARSAVQPRLTGLFAIRKSATHVVPYWIYFYAGSTWYFQQRSDLAVGLTDTITAEVSFANGTAATDMSLTYKIALPMVGVA